MSLLRALLLSFPLVLSACLPSSSAPFVPAPIPSAPDSLSSVQATRVSLEGFPEPRTPAQYNRAFYVRYAAQGAPERPRAVLVLMPGFLGGASGFDRLARSVVQRDPTLEVWAIDRRSNALEDQSRLGGDPLEAWKFYARGGFRALEPAGVPFMGSWGLEVHLGDLRRVIEAARARSGRVFLGGHSLGSVLTTVYAGWDFGGVPGWQGLEGLILLDGAPGERSSSQQTYLEGGSGPFGQPTPGVRSLEAGSTSPFVNSFPFGPAALARLVAGSRLAAGLPLETAPADFSRVPASNLAAAMVQADDTYSPLPTFTVSAGIVQNARVGLSPIALILGSGTAVKGLGGPRVRGQRLEWDSAAQEGESTDALDFVRRYWTPQADFQEWYFPLRLSVDLGAVGLEAPAWARSSLPLIHLDTLKLPVLAVRGGRGIVPEGGYGALERVTGQTFEKRTLEGFTHLDVLSAQDNPLIDWTLEFMR